MNCSSSSFAFGAGIIGSPPSGWVFYGSPPVISNLPAGETGNTTITVLSRENIPVDIDYIIQLGIGDGSRFYHSADIQTSLYVKCPPPRPVSHIVATPIIPFYSFGLQAGPIFLSWDSCGYGLWCCCPCKYRVERNGEVIGVSKYANFTDTSQLSVGVRYIYKVTTIDRNGIESAVQVCDNTIAVEVEPISFRNLAIFMAVAVSCILGLALMVYIAFYVARKIVSFRQKRKGHDYEEVHFLPQSLTYFFKIIFLKLAFWKKKKPLLELRGDDDFDDEDHALLDDNEMEEAHEIRDDEVEMASVGTPLIEKM